MSPLSVPAPFSVNDFVIIMTVSPLLCIQMEMSIGLLIWKRLNDILQVGSSLQATVVELAKLSLISKDRWQNSDY